jgi:hypothetical protein
MLTQRGFEGVNGLLQKMIEEVDSIGEIKAKVVSVQVFGGFALAYTTEVVALSKAELQRESRRKEDLPNPVKVIMPIFSCAVHVHESFV